MLGIAFELKNKRSHTRQLHNILFYKIFLVPWYQANLSGTLDQDSFNDIL
jgi:hypothetical protein